VLAKLVVGIPEIDVVGDEEETTLRACDQLIGYLITME
jgi:hypothetical protein